MWIKDICFFIDGSSFVHKTNSADQAFAPKSKTWRKKKKELQSGCTSKGRKAGYGGKVVNFLVPISLGKKIYFCE